MSQIFLSTNKVDVSAVIVLQTAVSPLKVVEQRLFFCLSTVLLLNETSSAVP